MMSEEEPDCEVLQDCAEAEGIFIQPKISMIEHAMANSTG